MPQDGPTKCPQDSPRGLQEDRGPEYAQIVDCSSGVGKTLISGARQLRTAQEAFTIAPTQPKDGPRKTQEASKTASSWPKRAHGRPRTAPREPKGGPRGLTAVLTPRRLQAAQRRPPRQPQEISQAGKKARRLPKKAPWLLKRAPRAPKTASQEHKTAPRRPK